MRGVMLAGVLLIASVLVQSPLPIPTYISRESLSTLEYQVCDDCSANANFISVISVIYARLTSSHW